MRCVLLTAVCVLGCSGSAPPAQPKPTPPPKPNTGAPKLRALDLALGAGHSCALMSDATVRCWGNNEQAQLGPGVRGVYSSKPVMVAGVRDAKAIAAGEMRTCVIRSDRKVVCWGAGAAQPAVVSGVTDALSISIAHTVGCARVKGEAVRCWTWTGKPLRFSIPLGKQTGVSYLDIGHGNGCVQFRDGKVSCWRYGPLEPRPEATSATSLAVGWWDACVVLPSGRVRCLDITSTTRLQNTSLVNGISGASQIVAVGRSFCVLLRDKRVTCWPRRRYGDPYKPRGVKGVRGAVRLAGGGGHACALLKDGRVSCWGSNKYGQLGRPPFALHASTHPIPKLPRVIGLAGRSNRVCVRTVKRDTRCWGPGWNARTDAITSNLRTPTVIPALRNATQLHLMPSAACALMKDGTVWCWGLNHYGVLGAGKTDKHSRTPVQVVGLGNVVEIAGGPDRVCARKTDGSVSCWGQNYSGQLGDGTTTHRNAPVAVAGLRGAKRLFAFGNTSCAQMSDRSLRCWGMVPLLGKRKRPTAIPQIGPVLDIDGASHWCFVTPKNRLTCWGANHEGQLGDGTYKHRAKPAVVANLTDVIAVQVVIGGTCALRKDGTAYCWGGLRGKSLRKRNCRLFDGPRTRCNPHPKRVPGFRNIRQMAFGYNRFCALISDGSVRCAGDDNGWGDAGDTGDARTVRW